MKLERFLLNKLKRKISVLCKFILIITIALGLTSCSLLMQPPFMYSPPDEKQQIEQQEKLVLDTINSRDISAIKGLFSKNAISQIDDIDGKLKEFLDFYSGEYVSSKDGSSIDDIYENGNHKKTFDLLITITTDKDLYLISCTDVVSNPKNLDDVGISQLEIIHKASANLSSAWHSVSKDVPEIKCFYENDEKGQQTK
ncbi:hypothetical protein CDLVIII_1228 [Clostridium sp. DL-VIII]|uniref:DUF5104 domain-containing protein n=1 Tax=Clostridium sp. DL-VIII TaxID=641107 RepID=UPI00023AF69C|nr:DUF5104 domain-containing protein [Clostridium sp. DL-VIII]EHI97930.1 hypothetical protein CDLVIII_1228 [Clostridium sp. DL-VIII]